MPGLAQDSNDSLKEWNVDDNNNNLLLYYAVSVCLCGSLCLCLSITAVGIAHSHRLAWPAKCHNNNINKSAQSNLRRGPPLRNAVAVSHTYTIKSPLVTMAHPKFDPQKYPFQWTDPQTPLPASSLLRCRTASGSDPPFFHNALDRQTDRPTDRSRESLTTIGRYAPRATQPNNGHGRRQLWTKYVVHIMLHKNVLT